MIYKGLPPVGALPLPKLLFVQGACSPRPAGVSVREVFVHRWGGGTFSGVVEEFRNPANQASAHFVYAGELGPDGGRCVQMVRLSESAWTEAAFNDQGVSIESADAIWLGQDHRGFARLARIVGWLLQHERLPAAWVRDPHTRAAGFCRHADGGVDGGGHTACPTTDLQLWEQFVFRVKQELAHGGFRPQWATD